MKNINQSIFGLEEGRVIDFTSANVSKEEANVGITLDTNRLREILLEADSSDIEESLSNQLRKESKLDS